MVRKFLVQDNNKIKKPVMEGLEEIGLTPVSVQMFDEYGTEDLSDIIGIVDKDVVMVYRQDLDDKKVEGYKLVGYTDISNLSTSENLVLVKENDKYFTFKNGEFIEVELSQENFTDKSVILLELTTPTKIVGITMDESRVLGEGKEFKKTINVAEFKARHGLIEKMSEI